MQRRNFLRNTGLTVAGLAFLNTDTLASFLSDPAWKIRMLNENTGVFTEKGGTILFQVSKEGAVFVDAQFPDTVPHLIEELKTKYGKIGAGMLINTHHHGDHTAGNIAFKEVVPKLVAHANSKINQENAAKTNKSEDKQWYPTETYTESWNTQFGKEKIKLHYFGSGHTNGDSIVHFESSNIIHMGDLVFNRRHPFVDQKAGASIKSWINVLNKTLQTFNKDTQYVSGHAGAGYDILLKADDVRAFVTYLENVLKFTTAQIEAGKTKEEIVKATEIPGSPEWKGDGIERPLSAAFAEISLNKGA